MPKTIEVQFLSQLPDEKGELYSGVGIGKKVYVRQPVQNEDRVQWFVSTKWNGQHETGTPLPAGTTVKVVAVEKKEKKLLFSETIEADSSGVFSAHKEEFFSFEQIQNIAHKYFKELELHSREKWSKWLFREAPKYNYTGYPSNWLEFGTTEDQQEILDTPEIIGIKYIVTSTPWKHMVSSQTWNVIEIRDADGQVVAISGYQYST